MSVHVQVPLGEICTINPRIDRSRYSKHMPVSFVPMAAVDERTGAIKVHEERSLSEISSGHTAFEEGDILFSKITPSMENGKIALACNLTNGVGYGSTEFYILRPGKRVLGEYIYHFVRRTRFREEAKRRITGTAQQRVPKSFIENTLIPLPSLIEQRRIVGILNRSARIERLHTKVHNSLENFVSSLFLEIFGDPLENPMGWDRMRLGSACRIVGGGTPRRGNDAYFGGDILWATPTDVTALNGIFIDKTAETITDVGLKESSARLVPAGSVLMTSRATIGYTAIAARSMATNQGFANLICGDSLVPEYISSLLRNRREELIDLASGTTFKEIPKSTLKDFTVSVPPLEIQNGFKEILHRATRVQMMDRAAAEAASALGGSLMAHLLEDRS